MRQSPFFGKLPDGRYLIMIRIRIGSALANGLAGTAIFGLGLEFGPEFEPEFGFDGVALLGPMVWPSRAGEPEQREQRLPFEAAVTPD